MKIIVLFLVLVLLGIGFFLFNSHKTITQKSSTIPTPSGILKKYPKPMTISSSAFATKQSIPSKYTCDGEGVNPPLQFTNVPADAKSLVLLVDDPDVPKNLKPDGVFDHWVVYNIDPSIKEIGENSAPAGVQGKNGAGKTQYYPACPPDREHRYFFKLYALDSKLAFDNSAEVTKQMVEEQMQGHILEQAELVGLYKR